jgi:TolB-like protein
VPVTSRLQGALVRSLMSSANLRLRLFGSPVVTGADGAPLGGGSVEPHRLALLALIALHPKRTVSRAELTKYLWPTRNAEQARQALNQALFAISKALGDDAIFPSAKEVRLGSRVSVDALEFQSALDAGRPEDAMRLYTAPLLDGFELDDAPEFQHWAATQRARFATAARTQRPVAAAAIEVLHDLAEPEKPEPTPEVAPTEKPGRKGRKEPEPPADFVLLNEQEVQARVEHAAEGPELRGEVPPEPELLTNAAPVEEEPVVNAAPTEPELMTNAVLPEQESVANVTGPGSQEPVDVVPPQPAPRDDIQIAPNEPSPAPLEATAIDAPPPSTPESQEDVLLADAPPAPVESVPHEKRAKRWRRGFPLPSARLVVTVLSLIALGALGYIARDWIAAVRGRADAVLQARDRKRSIAVLPIEYSGRNQADAALAARIVDELGPMLTRAGLLVMPSTALTRGGPPYDLRVIAESLGVAHILQGVMRREGARVAFRFRLVNPVDGTTRWDDTYRPMLADIQALQEDVAAKVGAQILGEARERD